jgi:hypothetical protein
MPSHLMTVAGLASQSLADASTSVVELEGHVLAE